MKSFKDWKLDVPIEIEVTVNVGGERAMIDEFYSLEDLEEKLYKIQRAIESSLEDQYNYEMGDNE